MIKKTLIAGFMLAAWSLNCEAQTDTTKTRLAEHYIGFQANELFRQILNLSNSTTAINNPYLLIYSINSVRKGWGGQIGIGYNYAKTTDKDAGNRVSEINDLSFRIGAGRKVMLLKGLQAGYGFDIVSNKMHDNTFSTTVTNFGNGTDSTVTAVTTKNGDSGFGIQLSLAYFIMKKLSIGTEVSYYYLWGSDKQNVEVTEYISDISNGNSVNITNTNTETDHAKFSITLPVALFLIIKI